MDDGIRRDLPHPSTSARPTSAHFQASYRAQIDAVDVVVFSAPQLSLLRAARSSPALLRRPPRHRSRCWP